MKRALRISAIFSMSMSIGPIAAAQDAGTLSGDGSPITPLLFAIFAGTLVTLVYVVATRTRSRIRRTRPSRHV